MSHYYSAIVLSQSFPNFAAYPITIIIYEVPIIIHAMTIMMLQIAQHKSMMETAIKTRGAINSVMTML